MRLITSWLTWRALRREQKHRRWMRTNHVLMAPHSSTNRNGTQAVP